MDSRWRIELLGGLCARQSGRTIARFRTHKTGLLLAYLALHRDRAHSREQIIELLWPDVTPQTGRNQLSMALSFLRHPLEPPGVPAGAVILADRTSVRLNPEALTTDVADFEAALRCARALMGDTDRLTALTSAVELYRGDLLPGYYEDWVLGERVRLREAHGQTLRHLTRLSEQTGDLARAVEMAAQAARLDPLGEEAFTGLLRLYHATGQYAAARRVWRDFEQRLLGELDETPSLALRTLVADLRIEAEETKAGEASGALRQAVEIAAAGTVHRAPKPKRLFQVSYAGMVRRDFGAPRADRAHTATLPLQLTRFIGREREVGQLRRLLLPDAKPASTRSIASGRLLTLTGPGGVGKTRLALEAAGQLVEPLSGAVFFAGVAEVREADQLADALLDALQLPRSPQRETLDQVIEFLKRQASLLLLDNFEQLLGEEIRARESVDVVRTLLEQVPMLTVLVTSRQRLGLAGERELSITPLQLPPGDDPERSLTPEQASGIESVALFVDRAQISRPDFQLTARNADAVAKLCAGLEGIPLAIELAAARAQVLTPSQMLGQLKARFKFLVDRGRVAQERHRTLEAAIEWSYRLLSPKLQRFFVQLSVFRGGWTLEAAEAMCQEELALDYLSQLRDSSLILAEEAGETIRFRMLETLREYAHDKLVESAEERGVRARHSEYYLDYVVSDDPRQNRWAEHWRKWLVQEEDNLLAAIGWRQEEPEYVLSLLLPIIDLLYQNWHSGGRLKEGWERALRVVVTSESAKKNVAAWDVLRMVADHALKYGDFAAAGDYYDRMISLGEQAGDRIATAIGLHGHGTVRWCRSDSAGAEACFQQALQIAETLHDAALLASCCQWLGSVAMGCGNYTAAEAYFQRSLHVPGNEDNRVVEANVLNGLGNLRLHKANYPAAQSYFEQALRGFQSCHDVHGQALSLNGLGMVAARTDQLDAGEELLTRARVIHHDSGDLLEEAISLAELGRIAMLRGRPESYALLREALEIRTRLGQIRETLETLEALACLAGQERDWERCVVLLTATAALCETLQFLVHRHMAIDRDGMLRTARAALDASTFQRAQESGATMELKHAVDYALQHKATP